MCGQTSKGYMSRLDRRRSEREMDTFRHEIPVLHERSLSFQSSNMDSILGPCAGVWAYSVPLPRPAVSLFHLMCERARWDGSRRGLKGGSARAEIEEVNKEFEDLLNKVRIKPQRRAFVAPAVAAKAS